MIAPHSAVRHGVVVRTAALALSCFLMGLATPPTRIEAAPIALVQNTGTDAGTTTSASLSFPSSNVAGNWIAVAIRAGQQGQVFTVTDTRGNTYRQALRFNESGDNTTLGIYYAENVAGGANSVTVSDAISGGTLRFAILEYSGVATSNSLGPVASAQGASASPASGSVTTTASGDLALGLLSRAGAGTFTPGAGFALRTQIPASPATKLVVEDRMLATVGPVAATGALDVSDSWAAAVATFHAAASGGADTQPPSAPSNLVPTMPGGVQVDLRWASATDNVGVTKYHIERCQGAGCVNFAEIAAVDTTMASLPSPLVASANPNYFQDGSGKPLVLSGSHTWNSLQDWGTNGTLQTFDFTAFVNFLVSHGHNFTYLWRAELPHFCGFPTTAGTPPDFTVGPHPWLRTGPGTASDGGLKFDLTQWDPAYFTRLRARTQALNAAGIYTGVYLFTGEWLDVFRCATDGFPFSSGNNINGISDGGGAGSMTMTAPNAITAFQDAFVEKVVDELNDLPNVMWIVSEEAPAATNWWQTHTIAHLRSYEAGKPFHHPIGLGVRNNLDDAYLYNSTADWVCPYTPLSPVTTCGSGAPVCKVNINDSDHSYFGMWNSSAQANRNYAWRNLTNGNHVAFMDPYDVSYTRESRNLCLSPVNGICSGPDPRWDNFRDNLGWILRYSRKLNLASVTPRPSLASTANCLAQTPAAGAEYLVYAPNGGAFTVDVSAMPSTRTLNVEWFNPATGVTTPGSAVPAGSSARSFTPPFSGDAVLYLVDAAGHARAPATPPSSYRSTGVAGVTYAYRVRAEDATGNLGAYSNNVSIVIPGGTTAVTGGAPAGLFLERISPNPSRGSGLSVSFTLPMAAAAKLELLDVAGRRVAGQDMNALGAGRHTVVVAMEGRLSPGLYMVRLTQGGESRTTRAVVIQ